MHANTTIDLGVVRTKVRLDIEQSPPTCPANPLVGAHPPLSCADWADGHLLCSKEEALGPRATAAGSESGPEYPDQGEAHKGVADHSSVSVSVRVRVRVRVRDRVRVRVRVRLGFSVRVRVRIWA